MDWVVAIGQALGGIMAITLFVYITVDSIKERRKRRRNIKSKYCKCDLAAMDFNRTICFLCNKPIEKQKCSICGTEWNPDMDQFGCWVCGHAKNTKCSHIINEPESAKGNYVCAICGELIPELDPRQS